MIKYNTARRTPTATEHVTVFLTARQKCSLWRCEHTGGPSNWLVQLHLFLIARCILGAHCPATTFCLLSVCSSNPHPHAQPYYIKTRLCQLLESHARAQPGMKLWWQQFNLHNRVTFGGIIISLAAPLMELQGMCLLERDIPASRGHIHWCNPIFHFNLRHSVESSPTACASHDQQFMSFKYANKFTSAQKTYILISV